MADRFPPELWSEINVRSGGRCEAEELVSPKHTRGMIWMRCTRRATEIHHMLPRSRGGRSLDRVGETYHLIHLCKTDHLLAHKDQDSLMIEGSVTWDRLTDSPRYQGPDQYLTSKYPIRATSG